MKDKVRALSKEYDMFPAGGTVLCAVSGGADSMCLLHLLRALAPEYGFTLQCAHFNHNLRGEESLRDEDFVRARCLEWGIPFHCGRGDVAGQAVQTGRGIEETARELRYAFLEHTAKEIGAARIATAHTANDNAETVLLHLVRGAGLQGLTGIFPKRGTLVRPMLAVTRAEVEEYCACHSVPYVEDSSNEDEGYTRNFLRRRVMPLLEQMNPRVMENLSAAAGRLRQDNEYLDHCAAEIAARSQMTDNGLVIEAGKVADAPEAIACRVIRRLLGQAGGGENCRAAHIGAVLRLSRSTDPSGKVDLPGLTVCRMYDGLVFAPANRDCVNPVPTVVIQGEKTIYGNTGWTVSCSRAVCPESYFKNPDSFFLACDKIKGPLVLRPRRTGDAIKLPGRRTKTVKKLLIDEKIPFAHRNMLPVLADDNGVLALASFGPNESRLAQPGEPALCITLRKSERDEVL